MRLKDDCENCEKLCVRSPRVRSLCKRAQASRTVMADHKLKAYTNLFFAAFALFESTAPGFAGSHGVVSVAASLP